MNFIQCGYILKENELAIIFLPLQTLKINEVQLKYILKKFTFISIKNNIL